MEQRNEANKDISLTINNNLNHDSLMIKTDKIEKKEKFEIINEEQNNQINKYMNKERGNIYDKEQKYFLKSNEFYFKYDIPLKQILPVGLRNLGNSCFMNCYLQCFYHCSKFTSEILEYYQKYEKMKCPVLSFYLEALSNLYTNGKELYERQIIKLQKIDDDDEYESDKVCWCERVGIKKNNKNYNFRTGTNPASAKELYTYIIKNYSNELYKIGSDPKIVEELILATMNKEIDPNFKYIRDNKISKNDEILLFNHIFNYYEKNKNFIASNFYWIKEKINICSGYGKETYNFQSEYISYFYPEAII